MRKRYSINLCFSSLILFNLLFNHGRLFANTAYTGIRENITPLEYTCEMGAGINLFNTLDATCNYQSGLATELCWGQPYTTKAMVSSMKNRGFETLRIPVTWFQHMGGAPNYTIDEAWMDRVEEVANFAFENDMHVIINIHHDDLKSTRPGSWLFPSYEKQDENSVIIEKLWTQIANRFKDYGDYLIFETLNEPRPTETKYEWNGGTAEHREVINHYNKVAVDAIRATGGNNSSRFIMTPQIAAQLNAAVNDLIIPNNDPRVLVSVHHYSPFSFALDGNGTSNWGTNAEIQALDNDIKKLYDAFVSKGIGVVMGEWGAGDKDNLSQRVNYYDIYAGIMKKYQVAPVVWMFNFNRTAGTWSAPELEDAILNHFENACEEGMPTVSFANIAFGQTFFSGEYIEVEVDAADENGTINYVELYLNNQLISRDQSSPYVWNDAQQVNSLTDMDAGDYTLRAVATDDEGNTTSKELTFRVVAPEIIPGSIEVESFYSQSGIQTETTSDIGGGENIGFIENGDYTEYQVKVTQSGIYEIQLRAASDAAGGDVELFLDNQLVATISVEDSKTDGWQDWYTTTAAETTIEEGTYLMKLHFKGGASYLYNLNWVEFTLIEVITSNAEELATDNAVYPNPTEGIIHLSTNEDWVIIDLLGIEVMSGTGLKADISNLKNGTYILKQKDKVTKVLKQ